uniref:ribosomal protein L35 n=1 Tax=Chroodactylon ornatum TaxID=139907 RepID=UPI001FCD0962|nr:ribosomal protein L35 [Chroodactylon ornatum]UNJ14601.1 ribosomal protein L35 [Chroodactylon ornatum]
MPKIKTCRAMAKRFRATKTNKIVRRKAGKSHLLEKKARSRKRSLKQRTTVDTRDIKNFVNKVPYIF